jgi:hypothetical protein
MIELVSGMPAPQFGDESSLSARIRAGSRFKRFMCFALIDILCFRLPPEVGVHQVEDHWSIAPRLIMNGDLTQEHHSSRQNKKKGKSPNIRK